MEQKHMSGKAALKIVVGSILAAYGLTLAVYAGFGGATLAIFWQGVANLTGLTIGGASLAVAVVMLAFVFLYYTYTARAESSTLSLCVRELLCFHLVRGSIRLQIWGVAPTKP